jgi:hypothetical protein
MWEVAQDMARRCGRSGADKPARDSGGERWSTLCVIYASDVRRIGQDKAR